MAFEKDKLSMVVDLSLAPRSMYGNIFINNGINIQDVKIYKRQKNIDLNHQIAILTEANNNLNDKLCTQLFTFDIHFNAEIDFEAIKRLMEADNCSRKSMLEEQIIS